MTQNIFLSYANKDARFVKELSDRLLQAGWKPWIDPNPRPGQDWRFAIDDAIRASDALIVVVSPAAAESIYVTYEWTLALATGVRVIPLIHQAADTHPRLRTLEQFDYSGWKSPEQFWDYFLRELRRVMSAPPARMPPASPAAGPAAPPEAPQTPPPARPPGSPGVPAYNRSVMPTEPGHWLVVRRGPQVNQMYRLESEVVSVGRDDANDITVKDPEVSRFHMRLVWQEGTYAVEDLDSTNGTLVDGELIRSGPYPLRSGKSILLGDAIVLSYEIVR